MSLLSAHHADDQAESVLMRIARMGLQNWTLRAMAEGGVNLPDTWGIHGVHESGLREYQHTCKEIRRRRYFDTGIRPPPWRASLRKRPSDETSGLYIEEGGVKLYRPLLRFPKGRLEATCLQHQVEWFEDDTNRDVTLTPRNAVRSLLEHRRLPGSLSPNALLPFMALMQTKRDNYEGHAENLFRRTKILAFDLRSGRLIVRLPRVRRNYQDVPQPHKESAYSNSKIRATMLLKRLVSLVTPLEHVRLSKLFPVVERMFTEFLDPDHPMLDETLMPTRFTIQGVLVERIKMPLERADSNAKEELKLYGDPEFVWSLTRKLYQRACGPPRISVSRQLPPRELYLQGRRKKYRDHPHRPRWQLWDGRYWIRVLNNTPKLLEIRPLRETDIPSIKARLLHHEYTTLRKTLAVAAPGNVRWTLPTIAEYGDSGEVVALPSLDLAVGHRSKGVSWQIRYKHVELSVHKDEDCVIR